MNLTEKIVGNITGKFVIESYQEVIGGQKMRLNTFLKILTRCLMDKIIVYNLLLSRTGMEFMN